MIYTLTPQPLPPLNRGFSRDLHVTQRVEFDFVLVVVFRLRERAQLGAALARLLGGSDGG